LYGRLPAVRTRVGGQSGPLYQLQLAASQTTIAPAQAITVSGSYVQKQPGRAGPIPGAALQIQNVSSDGVLSTLANITVDANGAFTTTLPFSQSAVLRAVHASSPASVSNLVVIGVKPVLTLTLASASPVQVSGTVRPAKPVTVSVYRLVRGRRKLLWSKRVKPVNGGFSARPSLGRRPRGTYLIVARVGADAVSLSAVSPAVR